MTTARKPSVERLARDMVSFSYDLDPYEFRDQYGSGVEGREAAYDDALGTLTTRSRLKATVAYLDEEPIDYDDDLESRRRSIVRRMRALLEAQPPAGRSVRAGDGRRRR